MTALGLYRLMTPYFLAGVTFPHEADAYLSQLGVADLAAAYDDNAVLYTGSLQFGPNTPRRFSSSNGSAGFAWDDIAIRFRLTVPRDGAALINTAVTSAPPALLGPLQGLLGAFLPVEQGTLPTEYPGIRFRLELMIDQLHFELGDSWKPGKLDSEHRIVADATITDPVRIILPKPVFVYEMTDDSLLTPPSFTLASWGGGGFDAPSTLEAGELAHMEPPIAVHKDGKVGFGLGSVVIDGDPNNTPPEILKFFGTDESFTGIYVQSARVYVSDVAKGYGFQVSIQDLLVSFAGEVSFDLSADLLGPEVNLSAKYVVADQGKNVDVNAGSRTSASTTKATVVEGGSFTATAAAIVQVEVIGGMPPHTVSVKADGGGGNRYQTSTGQVTVSDLSVGDHTLTVSVNDATASGQSYTETVTAHLKASPAAATPTTAAGSPADRVPNPGDLPPMVPSGSGTGTASSHAIVAAGNAGGTRERFRVTGQGQVTATAGGNAVTVTDGQFEIDVPENTTNLAIQATWAAVSSTPQTFELKFTKSKPRIDDWPAVLDKYVNDDPTLADVRYPTSRSAGQAVGGTAALREWLQQLAVSSTVPAVTIDASASWESDNRQDQDQALSERRLAVATAAIGSLATVGITDATGFSGAQSVQRSDNDGDRHAVLTATLTQPGDTASLTVSRAARPAPSTTPPPARNPTKPPAPLPSQPPAVFRRIGVRVKVIRNDPVLLELSGRLDFERDLEATMRNPNGAPAINGNLQMEQQAAASADTANPQDGVTDFRLTIVHDPAVHSWTETLAIGAHPDDVDGLLQIKNPHSGALTAENRLKDALGSVMILAPIIGLAVGATDPNSASSYSVLGGTIVGAAAVGASGIVQTQKITLYGGELRFRQFIPPGDPVSFSDAGVLFDYAVAFGVEIDSLGIKTTRPLKVRYRAIGFNINFQGGGYQPIFDTSKGYELDLSDPGLFKLPSPIDNVLKIFAARVAKVNPLTIELDLGMKVDLGVVRIDRFKVKLPVDPIGVPTILPSGISVDISKVIVGSGFVNIIEPPAAPAGQDQPGFGGIEGAFDVSLVPIKLRIAASFGVRPVTDNATGRSATAVFLGLIIDLPAPIPLAQSGIGIYGFSGLFAMHYKRLESDPNPNDATGPAILWLVAAGGEPAKLFNNGVELWGPEFDRWSFGVGVMLGTTEGGFLVNLRGMFVLELPGPRVLIFVKILIVSVMPDLKPATDLTVGILGVIDLDFARKSFTIGIIVNLEIKEIVSLVVPVELFTKLDDLKSWHLYIGTFGAPASALILDIVRGFGYVMIAGSDITGWPGYGQLKTLPGIAMAAGIGASIVFGDEGTGLYLKVSARADVGVSFSPRLFLVGRIQIDGELRLFIVSIGAHGMLDVEAPDPTHVKGEICGHVDFFFFSVEGCVTVEIGPAPAPPPPPNIVRNVWLQSHAPVITAGQGGDRPIDASLGDALPTGATGTPPVVPIDSVPVIQFLTAPTLGASLTTFTEPLGAAPNLPPNGWVVLGGDRKVSYELTEISLSGTAPSPGTPKAVWRPDPATSSASGTAAVDLALMSNVPLMGARALERSTDLTAIVDGTWGVVCDPVAPPAAVVWTFCKQPLGPSRSGWELHGDAWPDPPGTTRQTPVDVDLQVDEPQRGPVDAQLEALFGHTLAGGSQPARVIGPRYPILQNCGPGDPGDPGDTGSDDPGDTNNPDGDPKQTCVYLAKVLKDSQPNPANIGTALRVAVSDFNNMPYPAVRIGGTGARRGLDVGFRTQVSFAVPMRSVSLTLVTMARAAKVAAFDRAGAIVVRAAMTGTQNVVEVLQLTGAGIVRVVIDSPGGETVLIRVCVVPVGRLRGNLLGRLSELEIDPSVARPRLDVLPLRDSAPTLARPNLNSPAITRPGLTTTAATAPTPAPSGVSTHGPVGGPTRGNCKSTDCMRALALPDLVDAVGKGELPLDADLQSIAKSRKDERWIDLLTGPAQYATLYLVVDRELLAKDQVVIEQLDRSMTTISSDPLNALSPTMIAPPTAGLPSTWLDPNGPWWDEVAPVVSYLAEPEFANQLHLIVTAKPDPNAQRLRIRITPGASARSHPAIVLGVVEVLTADEVGRSDTETQSRSGSIDTLIGFLDGTSLVPLLAPATDYTLSVNYTPKSVDKQPDGSTATNTFPAVTESFRFKTDDAPPDRLDAYVLATNPSQEEECVFADEIVKIVFNDLQIVQLYQSYGRNLTVVLRGADGIAIPQHQVGGLNEVPVTFTSPLYAAVDQLVKSGQAKCVGGSYHTEGHGSYTVPVVLRPSMAYTLDVEAQPMPAPLAGKAVVPLFRRHFKTGRFTSLSALVDELKARDLLHKVLTGPIVGLAAGEATDLAIEQALEGAGLAPLGPPDRGSRVVLWRPLAGRYVPHAIILDADEPLWRFRDAPVQEPVPNQPDPAYERIIPGREPSLQLTATGPVAGFVRSPSGTRTVVLLNDATWPVNGATVTIAAERPASTLYAFAGETAVVTTLPLAGHAPWEEDDA